MDMGNGTYDISQFEKFNDIKVCLKYVFCGDEEVRREIVNDLEYRELFTFLYILMQSKYKKYSVDVLKVFVEREEKKLDDYRSIDEIYQFVYACLFVINEYKQYSEFDVLHSLVIENILQIVAKIENVEIDSMYGKLSAFDSLMENEGFSELGEKDIELINEKIQRCYSMFFIREYMDMSDKALMFKYGDIIGIPMLKAEFLKELKKRINRYVEEKDFANLKLLLGLNNYNVHLRKKIRIWIIDGWK